MTMEGTVPLFRCEQTARIISLLSGASRWILLSHTKPDGDTLGCGSALWSTGRSLGKDVVWGGPDPVPDSYLFLAGTDGFLPGLTLGSLSLCRDTVVVALDTSTAARSVADLSGIPEGVPLVNMDHHHDNEGFGTAVWVDPTSSSVGEMCWMLLRSWGIPIPLEAAEALYTAIVTDCGNFAFSCTTPRTHQAAADLLSLGVAPEKIDQLIRCSRTMGGLRLRGRALERVRSVGSFAAVTWIGKTDFLDTGSNPAETEFLVNELLTVRSVSFAVLFIEDDDCVRASLRSRGALSASEIAHAFGGGGHPQAAGCRLPLPVSEAVASLTALLEEKNDTLRSASAR